MGIGEGKTWLMIFVYHACPVPCRKSLAKELMILRKTELWIDA
jgi:predicted ATPase